MDELDTLLLQAWWRVSDDLQSKPWAMGRRMERVARQALRRPVRAWCLPLRASDSRIGAHELRNEFNTACYHRGFNHRLVLRGDRVRALCQPVWIGEPGVTVVEAAKLLGRDERTIWSWVKKGRLEVKRRCVPGPTRMKHRVWSGPMDPQADDGRGPWEVWGTLWQHLWERVPVDFAQRVERTARVRRKRLDRDRHPGHYRGWDWVCPGRVLATGQQVPCGRVCKKLWLPLPAWTIGDALGDRAGEAWAKMPRFEQPVPVRPDALGADTGTESVSKHAGICGSYSRRFACAKCWGMRFDNYVSDPDEAWNRFVSVVSGGLLYGREVDRGVLWQQPMS